MKNRMLLALLAEYRKAAIDYKNILENISQPDFVKISDVKTHDPDCHSIQTVSSHVIQSGYTYSNYITSLNNIDKHHNKINTDTPQNTIKEINKLLDFAESAFDLLWNKTDEELEKYSIKTSWGTIYDIEQLMEHAIVHILRHRRQIEFFLVN